MQQVTDWIGLWRDLVKAQPMQTGPEPGHDKEFKPHVPRATVDRHWAKRDSNRDFVVSALAATPGATLLDIGAGTGSWARLLAPHARQITALDVSPEMLARLRTNLEADGVTNVTALLGTWPDVEVEPHDFSFCSHGMYACADWPAFVQRMVAATRRTCMLVMRAPTPDGVMAEAAMHIWGQPYDSPNFQVGYNALLQMGIFPNVQMADSGLWSPWKNASLGQALVETKRRFGLESNPEHDDFLLDLLRRRLTPVDGEWVWPRSVRSALVYWNVDQ